MEKHEIVARVHRWLSWFYAFIGIALFVAMTAIGGKESLAVAFFLLVLCGGFFLIHRQTARGASAKKPWARILSMVIAFFLLGGFPIGTLIGMYLLMNTWGGWDRTSPPPRQAALPKTSL